MMENKIYKFEEGSMWEGYPWQISMNEECSELGGGKPCRHSRNIHIKTRSNYSKEKIWEGDIVIAFNEGNENSTGVCLWCILEAVDQIGLER